MRTTIRTAILVFLVHWPLVNGGLRATSQAGEPNSFFHDFVGLSNDQIAAIRKGKAIAKILDSRTPDEVFVFGSVYVESTPERYLRLASDLEELRKLPNYLAIREFSNPPQL